MKVTRAGDGQVWLKVEIPRGARDTRSITVQDSEKTVFHLLIDDPAELIEKLTTELDRPNDGDVWNIYGQSWGYSADRKEFVPLFKDAPADSRPRDWQSVREWRDQGFAESTGINVKDVW